MDWTALPSVVETAELTRLMWERGWDEANGGNVTYLLTPGEVAVLGPVDGGSCRTFEVGSIPDALRGATVLVSATGSHFRAIAQSVPETLGILRLPQEGTEAVCVAGLEGNRPSSELAAHLAAHGVRLAQDPAQRVIMHNHATHVIAMTHSGPTDGRGFTRALWPMLTEAMYLFPDGVGFVPWCPCGGQEIARLTEVEMERCRIVVWQYHGVLVSGRTLSEAFGLLETVDKCCELWLLSRSAGAANPGISDAQLLELARAFSLEVRPGYLECPGAP